MKIIKKDIIGKRYGSLTVTDNYEIRGTTPSRKVYWMCKCDCGNEFFVESSSLKRRKVMYCNKCRHAGIRNSKLYHIYHGIKQRCKNTNNPNYPEYGGKGILICEEWDSDYKNFEDWSLSNGYSDGLTIDRINSDGNYCPNNCRWISLSENSSRANIGRHKNKTKLINPYAISPDGTVYEIDNISKFCKEHNLNISNVSAALHGRCQYKKSNWKFYSNKNKL